MSSSAESKLATVLKFFHRSERKYETSKKLDRYIPHTYRQYLELAGGRGRDVDLVVPLASSPVLPFSMR